jgi:hypothetical protein
LQSRWRPNSKFVNTGSKIRFSPRGDHQGPHRTLALSRSHQALRCRGVCNALLEV